MTQQSVSIGEKIISFLRQPLFTFPLSIPQKTKKEIKTKPKTVKKVSRIEKPTKLKRRRYEPRNSSQNKNIKTQIISSIRNKDEYEKIRFILRACDDSKNSSFTNVLHVEKTKNGSRLIATDGKRMHVAEIKTKIKEGEYKPIITNEAIIFGKPVTNINYPNWKRVVPTDVIRRGCINFENARNSENCHVFNSFKKMSGEKVNPKFLADLTKKPWVIYSQKQKTKALLLKEYGAKQETYAVIMPLSA